MTEGWLGWIELCVATLLVLSGLFTLAAGVGVLRFQTFFQRMHPPALAFSLSAWCVALASVLFFSARREELALHAWLIIIFLAITVPVTTILLARTELFRRRTHGASSTEIPPPLSHVLRTSSEAVQAPKVEQPGASQRT
jgi:multicomponent K+:H+ antiporter subunit G